MPAGAFAASGPTRHGRSKPRSRNSHAGRRDPYSLAGAEVSGRSSAPHRASPEEQNCLEKVFRDNVVVFTKALTPRCAARLDLSRHSTAVDAAWCRTQSFTTPQRNYINV